MQQSNMCSALRPLIVANLKALRTKESQNQVAALILMFDLNSSFGRNCHEMFDSSRSLGVE